MAATFGEVLDVISQTNAGLKPQGLRDGKYENLRYEPPVTAWPIGTSGNLNMVLGPPMTKSAANASSAPPPIAKPCTAATTNTFEEEVRRVRSCKSSNDSRSSVPEPVCKFRGISQCFCWWQTLGSEEYGNVPLVPAFV